MFVEVVSSVLILLGSVLVFISALGLVRLEDFYMRISASTKATTMGLGFILAGIVVYQNDLKILIKVSAILFFVMFISPLAAHVIARSAVKTGVPFWERTNLKDVEGSDLEGLGKGSQNEPGSGL